MKRSKQHTNQVYANKCNWEFCRESITWHNIDVWEHYFSIKNIIETKITALGCFYVSVSYALLLKLWKYVNSTSSISYLYFWHTIFCGFWCSTHSLLKILSVNMKMRLRQSIWWWKVMLKANKDRCKNYEIFSKFISEHYYGLKNFMNCPSHFIFQVILLYAFIMFHGVIFSKGVSIQISNF